jgi:undecaprenyl-diphosphatase
VIRRPASNQPVATAAWAVALAGCLVAFVSIGWLVSQPGVPPLDRATTDVLHGLATPSLDTVMHAVTDLGSTAVLAALVGVVAVLLLLRERRADAAFIVVALAGSLLLNDLLKAWYDRLRPGLPWAVTPPESGFPSGHSMNSFVVYVTAAALTWRVRGRRAGLVAFAVAIVIVLAVGTSRIYLGVHWLSDVIGGYLAGAVWLLALAAAWAVVSRPDGAWSVRSGRRNGV